jgi:7-carboxy-7-deazaguanine synthase
MNPHTTLLVHSIFLTIQGEGPFAGLPAVFVRLGSCNLACPKCDTDFKTNATEIPVEEVEERILKHVRKTSLVVITGGEPFAHPIELLVQRLLRHNYRGFFDLTVQIETNGSLFRELPFRSLNLHVVCSPKLPKISPRLAPFIRAYKYLVEAGQGAADGLPARSFGGVSLPPARPPLEFTGPVYLQPVDTGDPIANKENLTATIASCLEHNYRLCVQIHKIIGME